MIAGLPTKTRTFGDKRYSLDMCFPTKGKALIDTAWWRRRGYSARVVTFDGVGALPVTSHYCLYYRHKKGAHRMGKT